MTDLLQAAKAHIAARDALADTPVERLKLDDPRFAAVTDTLADLRAAVASADRFAAGPELLAALKALCGAVASGDVAGCLIHHSPTGWANTGEALAAAEAIIAKAEALPTPSDEA